MKRNATVTATAGTATTAISYADDHITVLGQTMPAAYSVSRSGDVYAFTTIATVSEADGRAVKTPIRIHVAPDMPGYGEAREAAAAFAAKAAKEAKAAASQPKAEKPAAKPAAKPQPKAEKPAKPAAKPQPKAEKPAAKAPAAQPKAERVADRNWVGTSITGKGWAITFDATVQRTVVTCKAPSAKQKAAIEAAGFYWSPKLGGWVKKLTCKAYRAAQELAAKLGA